MAKHRLSSRRTRAPLRHPVQMVDVRTGVIHLLTPVALAVGADRDGRYIALCGANVLCSAEGTDPGVHQFCWSCRCLDPTIPTQRSEEDTR